MENLNRKYEFSMNVEQLDSVFSTGAKFSTKDVKTGELHIQLTKSGNIINLHETLCYANILKPDGEVIAHECEVIDVEKGIVKLDLVTDAMNQPGLYNFEIVVTNSEEKLVTPTMQYQCYESLNDGDKIEASNEFGLLEKALIKVDLLRSEFEDLYENLERNESTRVSNESIRTQNENQRQTNESNRVSSEQNRQASFNKMVQDNNSYKDEIKNVINEFKEDINSDFDNYKKGINSDIFDDNKIDFFGKEHDSMKHRLNSDFDNLHQRINDSSLLAYEGVSIKADNSYYGLQKDTVIKGRTLQNLINNSLIKKNSFKMSGSTTIEENEKYFIINRGNVLKCALNLESKLLKPNTKYTLILTEKDVNTEVQIYDIAKETFLLKKGNITRGVFTTFDTVNSIYLYFMHATDPTVNNIKVYKNSIIILEGDHTNTPLEELPFIEGIESAGDKSKNLINLSTLQKWVDNNEFEFLDNEKVLFKGPGIASNPQPFVEVKVKPNTNMSFTAKTKENNNAYVQIYSLNEGTRTTIITNYDFKTTSILKFNTGNTNTIAVHLGKHTSVGNDVTFYDVQLEEGEIYTPYQPYYEGYKISGKSCGKNLIDLSKITTGYIHSENGQIVQASSNVVTPYMKIKPNTNYIGYSEGVSSLHSYSWYDINKNFIKRDSTASGVTSPSNAYYLRYHKQYVQSGEAVELTNVKIQVSEGTLITQYEPYQESTYSYILNEPLRSLPNGVCDTIDLATGVLTRRVEKVVLAGAEPWGIHSTNTNENGLVNFKLDNNFKRKDSGNNSICDRFPYGLFIADERNESHHFGGQTLYIRKFISSNITTVSDFKQWLQANPTTVYYELAEPTTEQLAPCQLKSFDTTTHIISDNKLMPIVSTKIPSDVNAVVQGLKVENKNLEKQLDSAIEELNNKDVDLIATDWETDYRLCELEWTLLDTMKVETLAENKVVENRIMSRYEQAKILIENGKYNKSTMEKQLTTYHNRRCLTDEEYNELMELMNR